MGSGPPDNAPGGLGMAGQRSAVGRPPLVVPLRQRQGARHTSCAPVPSRRPLCFSEPTNCHFRPTNCSFRPIASHFRPITVHAVRIWRHRHPCQSTDIYRERLGVMEPAAARDTTHHVTGQVRVRRRQHWRPGHAPLTRPRLSQGSGLPALSGRTLARFRCPGPSCESPESRARARTVLAGGHPIHAMSPQGMIFRRPSSLRNLLRQRGVGQRTQQAGGALIGRKEGFNRQL